MFQRILQAIRPAKGKSMAGPLRRLGWTGFWLQVVFGIFALVIMIYYFAFSRAPSTARDGLAFIEYLTLINLALLAFTTFWSYRYTRLSKQFTSGVEYPTDSTVVSTVWTGVVASALGMLFSMIVIFIEAANLLFYFLKAPQAGMPVIQTSGAEGLHWVSSVDMVSLMSLILILFAELIVLVFSLWLLFRASHGVPDAVQPKQA